MAEITTYNIISQGELLPGYELTEVQQAFAESFKVPLAQAEKVVGSRSILKKNIDRSKAQLFKQRLEAIGMVISLEAYEFVKSEPVKSEPVKNKPVKSEPAPRTFASLALEPIDESDSATTAASSTSVAAIPTKSTTTPAVSNTSICPKCGLEQPKTNECRGCGIFFDKYQARAATLASTADPIPDRPARATSQTSDADEQANTDDEVEASPDNIDPKVIAGAAGAALAGAVVWVIVATVFNYELGIIAWGIGGLVGFVAAKLGSRGDYAGAICGGLALLAILGGKYMVVDSYRSQLTDLLAEGYDTTEFQAIYEETLQAADIYVAEVNDDATLRQFMVDYEYTEHYEADDVTQEEIDIFKTYAAPDLERFASEDPSLDEWMSTTVETAQAGIAEYSTIDLMREDFAWIDLLFYFLGVSTAFKLGRGS